MNKYFLLIFYIILINSLSAQLLSKFKSDWLISYQKSFCNSKIVANEDSKNNDYQYVERTGGLYFHWNFIYPTNYSFKNRLDFIKSYNAGILISLSSPLEDIFFSKVYIDLSYFHIGSKFKNNASFISSENYRGQVNLETIYLEEFNIHSGQIGLTIEPRLFDFLYLIGGINFVYGAFFTQGKYKSSIDDLSSQRFKSQNLFLSKGYILGGLLPLSKVFIISAAYYSSFGNKDTDWKGLKIGIVITPQKRSN